MSLSHGSVSMKIWYDHEQSVRMAKALLEQGPGARYEFVPSITAKGELDVHWWVMGGQTALDGGDPPNGDDSHICPPNFPPGQTEC